MGDLKSEEAIGTEVPGHQCNREVSVIIPTYNRYESLIEAIESIDHADAEVIVVDDGSLPPVSDFLRKNTDRELILVQKENGGVSSARNAGIERATGRYIAFLDSDDQFVSGKLQRLISILETQPNIDFAFHDISRTASEKGKAKRVLEKLHSDIYPITRITAEHNVLLNDNSYLIPSLQVFRNLTSGTPIFPSSVVLRRRLIERIGPWSEKFSLCEDMEYFARALLHTDAIYIHSPLTIMGIGEDNLSKNKIKLIYSDIAVLRSLSKFCTSRPHSHVLKDSICRRLQALGWHEKQLQHYKRAANSYKESIGYKFTLKSALNFVALQALAYIHPARSKFDVP